MVQGKIEADTPTIHLDATPSGLSLPPSPSSPHFMPNAFSAVTLPIYRGLRQHPITLACIPGGRNLAVVDKGHRGLVAVTVFIFPHFSADR